MFNIQFFSKYFKEKVVKQYRKLLLGGMVVCLLFLPQTGFTEDSVEKMILDEVNVIGSKENVKDIAASAAYIDVQDIRKQSYDNLDRILRKIPGVNTREEDGQGLFPNISVRGVDAGRSAKVTIMEDGILTAPAPYSAPAAYYSPTAGRMSAIEILKGSSQVRYGPHTTAGVLNFLSTTIPETEEYYTKTLFGSFGEMRNHVIFGNTLETSKGRFGYVIENYVRRNNGFRTIDAQADFRNGDDTGMQNTEPMIKLSFEPNTSKYQRFEVKFGYNDRDANESYLGQTEASFRNTPFKRLAASRFDEIDTEHFRSYVRHFIELDSDTNLVTTAYGNHFFRNWQKLHECRTPSLALSRCLEDGVGEKLLHGSGAGVWRLRNNSRNYYLYGLQSNLTHNLSVGATEHKLHFGARYHYDQIRRFQIDEDYTQGDSGAITSVSRGAAGAAGNKRQSTTALAFNAEDEIKYGQWTVKPGARYEQLWQHYQDFGSSLDRDTNYGVWAAGSSFDYRLSDTTNTFFGINRGFSTPDPNGGTKGVAEETSMAYEMGTRYNKPEKGFSAEMIGFWTEIDDMVITAITGSGGTLDGETANIGQVRSRGVELQMTYDPSIQRRWTFQNPWYFTMTFTDATFRTDVSSTKLDEANIFTGAQQGNEVPNIPQVQFAVGTSFIFDKLTVNLDGQYVGETFGTGNNATNNTDLNGNKDVRYGKTDSVFLLDLGLSYKVNPKVKLFTNLRNVTNEVYLASRLPHGVRGGAPFQAFGGMEINF